jgi:hypothetical protein
MKNAGQAMETLRDANVEMIGGLEAVCTAKDDIIRESTAMESLMQSEGN